MARASAALRQSETVEEEDVARALRLCLIPRAQQLPEMGEPPPESEPEPEQADDTEPPPAPEQPPPDEKRLLEAALAAVDEHLLVGHLHARELPGPVLVVPLEDGAAVVRGAHVDRAVARAPDQPSVIGNSSGKDKNGTTRSKCELRFKLRGGKIVTIS